MTEPSVSPQETKDRSTLLFAFGLEEIADATAEALLEQRVAVRKVDPQLPGQPPPDRRLADSGQADQADSKAR